jgi:crotonobetainyl-CoA:carnitine CoA-transferase CaiB-like acyl-CoA transferase
VAAFAAYDARDMLGDDYLWKSQAFVRVEGEPLPGFAYQLSRTPPAVHRPVADVGEHNREVLSEAGFSADDIGRWEADGTLADHPTL